MNPNLPKKMKLYKRSRKRLQQKASDLLYALEGERDLLQLFQPMNDKNNSFAFRIFWAFLVVACILIYCYQIYDRVFFYMQSPIAVDVYEEKLEEFQFPDSHVCVPTNKYILDYYNSSLDTAPIEKDSLSPIDKLITRPDVDLTKVWNLNYSLKAIHNLFAIDVRRQQHKINVPLNITMIDELQPWGTCTKFIGGVLKGSEIFTRIGYDITANEVIPGTSFTLISTSVPLDFQVGFVQTAATYAKLGLSFKLHQFVNTKKRPCVPLNEYVKCGKECVESRLNKNHCWLPYRPRYSKGRALPLCNNSKETLEMYQKNKNDMVAPNPQVECGCTRNCEIQDPDAVFVLELNADGTSLGSWHLLDDNVVITKERLIYKLDNLICDFGGNLGLWLGLSSLSLLNLIAVAGKQCAAKLIHHKDRTTRQIEAYVRANLPTPKPKIPKKLNFVFYLCLIAFSGFILQERIQLYLNKPIQRTVAVEDPTNVSYPNVIICAGQHNPRVMKVKEKYFKQQNHTDKNCNVDMFDLIGNVHNKIPVPKLWDLTYKEPISPLNIKIYNPFPHLLFDVRTFSKFPNPLGTCIKHSFGSIKYQLYTMFVDFIPEVNRVCKPDYTQVYITPIENPDFSFVFNTACFSTLTTAILIRRLNNHRLNTKLNPCNANLTEYYICKHQCLDHEIKTKQLCSMPFAIKEGIAFCNSSASAKAVRALYYETHTKIDVEKQCFCLPPCKQPFYKLNTFNFASFKADSSIILVTFPTNRIETIAEEFKYSFVALVSDIGNIFALTVGLSVLAAIHFSFYSAFLLVKNMRVITN